jgi:hypothetical protein
LFDSRRVVGVLTGKHLEGLRRGGGGAEALPKIVAQAALRGKNI